MIPDVTILGPYPGNRSLSIERELELFSSELKSRCEAAGLRVAVSQPGSAIWSEHAPRRFAYRDNYVRWPMALLRMKSAGFHIIDQGLSWYGRFLRGGRRMHTVNDLFGYLAWKRLIDLPPVPASRIPLIRWGAAEISKADIVLCRSMFTARTVVDHLPVDPSKVRVIPHAIEDYFQPISAVARAEGRRRLLGENGQFLVLHVGQVAPHKNRTGAVAAFALLAGSRKDVRMLCVHGGPTTEESQIVNEHGIGNRIRFSGPVSTEELRMIYGCADVLVFPSYYEGFGRPPLEAMACGCPVVLSSRGSLREIGGDAGLAISDPDDHTAIATVLDRVLREPELAAKTRAKGLEHVRAFRKGIVLEQMTGLYEDLCGSASI